MFPEVKEKYSNLKLLKESTCGAKSAIDELYEDLNNIKNYENKLFDFINDYYFIKEPIKNKDVDFLGTTYITYYPG